MGAEAVQCLRGWAALVRWRRPATQLVSAVAIAVALLAGCGASDGKSALAFRYVGVLCSTKGCLLQTVKALCDDGDVTHVSLTVKALSGEAADAVVTVQFRGVAEVEGRTKQLAELPPFRPTEVKSANVAAGERSYCDSVVPAQPAS